MLADNGYGVLLYDRRGEGASEGDPNGWGWDFDKDIKAGIAFLQQREDVEPGRIGGLGLSVGGEMLLQTAAEDTDLAAVVSEGAGARTVAEEVSDAEGLEKVVDLPDLPRARCRERGLLEPGAAAAPEGADPEDRARPVLLIHAGSRDVGTLNPDYYRAARAAQADLAGARGRPHRRNRRTAERVRAPRRRASSTTPCSANRGAKHAVLPPTALTRRPRVRRGVRRLAGLRQPPAAPPRALHLPGRRPRAVVAGGGLGSGRRRSSCCPGSWPSGPRPSRSERCRSIVPPSALLSR